MSILCIHPIKLLDSYYSWPTSSNILWKQNYVATLHQDIPGKAMASQSWLNYSQKAGWATNETYARQNGFIFFFDFWGQDDKNSWNQQLDVNRAICLGVVVTYSYWAWLFLHPNAPNSAVACLFLPVVRDKSEKKTDHTSAKAPSFGRSLQNLANLMIIFVTRWAPTSFKCSYKPIRSISGLINR